ncbi:MAG TPA: HNH endonuclease [Gammaproteobacteria bacterium]|nr:HNH endonuclease [Gammaproteobacteria bacterium]
MTTYLSTKLRQQIEQDAGHRCGYCLSDETLTGIPLSVEHILPEALGGETIHDNLCLACRPCNEYKGIQIQGIDTETGQKVSLFHPRQDRWHEHFEWSQDGCYMIGKTPIGRATITALRLNRKLLVNARKRWVIVGWHPPK